MKQWNIDIDPKCKDGAQLFVTSRGKVRPCIWISERSPEVKIFDDDPRFDLHQTPLNEIVSQHLKGFTDAMQENPYNALKVCFYECAQRRTS